MLLAVIGIQWQVGVPIFRMIETGNLEFSHKFSMEIFIIATWQIWKQRNDMIFENRPASFNSWKRNFREECCNQALRMKDTARNPFLVWVYNPL
jgi:hypothetical protein